MRILITGANGQLGAALQPALSGHELILKDLPAFDLANPRCESEIVDAAPDVIIHAGAYTDVDGAEREPERARAVNVAGTERVAKAAARTGTRLIYISTDYVFDGAQSVPYAETARPNPLNQYGLTKWLGEQAVLSSGAKALVVRTAWLYGLQGKNFVRSIMRAAREQPVLNVVNDQRGCPTYAGDLAETLAALLPVDVEGILHVTNRGDCTWHEFAQAIVQDMGSPVPVLPISTAQAGRLAKRPAYSVLSHDRLATLGLALPDWKEALSRFMRLASASLATSS
jgi:dTDP-4-dehydrorhamnose reductase